MTTTYTLNDVDLETVATLTQAIAADPERAQTTWKAEVAWEGGFRSETRIRDFAPLGSDEPPALGGSDTAPNPVEQLLGALGNCLAVGVAAGATARQIAIDDLRIELEGDLDLSAFLGLREGHAGFSSVTVRIHLETDADAEVVAELISRVVATSPVGHTLEHPVPLEVTIA